MSSKKIICFICGKVIEVKHLATSLQFTDKTGKQKYRHEHGTRNCQINYQLKPIKKK